MDLKSLIRNIPDFPKPGIMFKDITTLLKEPAALREVIKIMADHYRDYEIDYIAGIEARGFIIAVPLALALNVGFIPIRKPGKLPAEKISATYELEYGNNILEIHKDAINPGDRVILIDDLLATGGTIKASVDLIEGLGGKVSGIGFLLELGFLKGRDRLEGYDIFTLLSE